MKNVALALLLSVTQVAAVHAEDDYRNYLHKISGFANWFRVGTYQLQDGKTIREVDLYYSDSDLSPTGSDVLVKVIPNSFGLYCVWKTNEGNWTHKEVAGRARVGFSKILSADASGLIVQLYVKRVYRAEIPAERDRWRAILKGETDDYFRLRLSFVGGQPLTEESTAEQAVDGKPPEPPQPPR